MTIVGLKVVLQPKHFRFKSLLVSGKLFNLTHLSNVSLCFSLLLCVICLPLFFSSFHFFVLSTFQLVCRAQIFNIYENSTEKHVELDGASNQIAFNDDDIYTYGGRSSPFQDPDPNIKMNHITGLWHFILQIIYMVLFCLFEVFFSNYRHSFELPVKYMVFYQPTNIINPNTMTKINLRTTDISLTRVEWPCFISE